MKIKFLFSTLLFLLITTMAGAQLVDTTGITVDNPFDPLSLDSLLNTYQLLYGALVILWGYIAKAFGLKVSNRNFVFTVLAGGIVLAGGFLVAGIGKVLPLLFSFLGAIGIYDLILKPTGMVVPGRKVARDKPEPWDGTLKK